MSWFKIAAIAGGLIIAFLIVGSVVHFILAAITTIVIAALVVGGVAVAIKMARSGKQVSRKQEEREVRDQDSYQPLPRADVEQVKLLEAKERQQLVERPEGLLFRVASERLFMSGTSLLRDGADERLDKGNARSDVDRRLLVLKTVTRAHFHDAYRVAHVDYPPAGSSSANSTPSPTMSPTLHLSTFSTPANGARRVCYIFITSNVRIGAPFSKWSPSAASKATTVPGSGATILSSPTCSSSSPPKGSTQ